MVKDAAIERVSQRCLIIGLAGVIAILLFAAGNAALHASGLGIRTPVLCILLLAVLGWIVLLGCCVLRALHVWSRGARISRRIVSGLLSLAICLGMLAALGCYLLSFFVLSDQKTIEQDQTTYIMQPELEGFETVGFSYHKRVLLLFYVLQPTWSDTDYERWQQA